MPAESFHSGQQTLQPGETLSPGGIILPPGVGRERNVRETIQGQESQERSAKYNSQGVDFNNPYNYFYQEKGGENQEASESRIETHDKILEQMAGGLDAIEVENKKQAQRIAKLEELLGEQNKQIAELKNAMDQLVGAQTDKAEKQPRRVRRLEDGTMQRLVKYADGSFEWATIEKQTPTTEAVEDEKEASQQPAEESEAEVEGEAEAVQSTTETSPEEENPAKGKELVPFVPRELELVSTQEEGVDHLSYQVEMPEELEQALEDARDRYAEQTAKKRNSYLGHFLRNSKYWAKIPGLKALADTVNEHLDEPVEEARREYEQVIAHLQAEVQKQYESEFDESAHESEDYKTALKLALMMVPIQSQPLLETKICEERQASSKKGNKFVNWWVSREGKKGKLAKALVIGGVGGALGVGMGLLAIPAAGAVLGGAAGLGIAQHITKRRANGIIKGEGVTLAEHQQRVDMQKQQDFINTQVKEEGFGSVTAQDLTTMVDDRTAAEVQGNRARAKAATSIGMAAGGLGGAAGEFIKRGIDAANTAHAETSAKSPTTPDTTPSAGTTGPEAPAPGIEHFTNTPFNIEPGSGFTKEIMEYATANGHTLQPDQAFQLHKELVNHFGTYIQNANNNPIATYMQGSDLRISAPGTGHWAPNVADYIQNWISSKGL